MQTIETRPVETRRPPVPNPGTDPSQFDAGYDIALIAAVLGPLVTIGALIAFGVSVGVAVCMMFLGVFAVTTTLDVRWLSQNREARRASSSRART